MTDNESAVKCGNPKCGRLTPQPLRRGVCNACYLMLRRRQTAYGRWDNGRVDAAPVRDHVIALKEAGVSYRKTAELAGLDTSYIQTLLYGRGTPPAEWVTEETAEKILAVEIPASVLDVADGNELVPAIGVQRRLRALFAAGWPMCELAREIDMPPSNFGRMVLRREFVPARRHQQAVELFNRLQLVPGPSERCRALGRERRWALPMQWDEDDIDNPDARPVPASARRIRRTAVSA